MAESQMPPLRLFQPLTQGPDFLFQTEDIGPQASPPDLQCRQGSAHVDLGPSSVLPLPPREPRLKARDFLLNLALLLAQALHLSLQFPETSLSTFSRKRCFCHPITCHS